ncbi:hypothetical protein LEP1GSC008_3695 [Leptospira kirschneri serovar Bulgarica str. Nikolaevo]|uniref:Uncharacterized protein n=1 Tax=Leptospira kirschneri serovar Bulgarica str. Nikolaevo TaxID=1240687 RepID=M6FB50_9LEPT|nr:hypothetical protein LEP1GSC008_3695 [Leptospira kirschneri serovar Bulgarica str. Nikolaevo]
MNELKQNAFYESVKELSKTLFTKALKNSAKRFLRKRFRIKLLVFYKN